MTSGLAKRVRSGFLEPPRIEADDSDGIMVDAYLATKCAEMVRLAEALSPQDAEPDLYSALVSSWLELRGEWNRCNQTVQYAMVRELEPHNALFLKAGAASTLLKRVETLLEPEDLQRLYKLAEDPLFNAPATQ